MLQVPDSPVPCISISFAPYELPPVEPKSPFTGHLSEEPDSPRPQHLLPPPVMSPRPERHGQLSPLSPRHPDGGKGLERARFEAMLKASKERSAMVGARKPLELRKEIAVKAQKAKQFERRARFLSKLAAPPSPSAADMPVTPPDSPAVFHFTLPSPGLESPLELFENMTNHPELYQNLARIEQVDFRLPQQKQAEAACRHRYFPPTKSHSGSLPSLDQISQRLSKVSAPIRTTRSPSPEQGLVGGSRLPSFLRSHSPSPQVPEPIPAVAPLPNDQAPKRPRLTLPTLALRTATKPVALAIRTPTPIATKNPAFHVLPPSPKSPRLTRLQITTTICPPTSSKSSPTEFTEENITQFGSDNSAVTHRATAPTVTEAPSRRAQVTKDMFNKLSRRTPGLPGAAACGVKAQDDTSPVLSPPGVEDKLRRRTSAPAEMSAAQRGARHPVLEKPGGF